MELTVPQVLKKAAEKAGLKRVRYIEKNCPTTMQNCTVCVAFNDFRTTFILSSLLLRRVREEMKGSKYFIVCGLPGMADLFPYADEYWEIKDYEHLRTLYNESYGFESKSDKVLQIQRILHIFFEDFFDLKELEPFYHFGFQQDFFDRFKHIKRFLPSIPSSMVLGQEFNRDMSRFGRKIFVCPTMYVQQWRNGKLEPLLVPKEFWFELCHCLIEEGITPVILRNFMTYDLSSDFVNKSVYFESDDILHVMSAMRATGCVLDVYSGLSRLAIGARTPFIGVQDRLIFNQFKEYEIDDLCGPNVPREYLYLFPGICEEVNRNYWKHSIFNAILNKAKTLLALNRDSFPSTTEDWSIVPYDKVREMKSKKLGTRFIKIAKY